MPGEYVKVGEPLHHDGRLTVALDVSPGLTKYFRERTFWADYGDADALAGVPSAVLAIPPVGSLITLAWTLGFELRVDVLDRRFATALDGIGRTVQGIYPRLKTDRSALIVAHPQTVQIADSGRVGLLFSGGLDSNAALVEHDARVTDLFTVWGADVPIADLALWEQLGAVIADNPAVAAKSRHRIKSNLREFLDNHRLSREFGSFLLTGSWWGGIQVGLGLQSLVAPLAARHGLGLVLEASSLTDVPGETFIFSPAVDDQIAWAGTAVRHDGFHRTRQQKIHDVIAPHVTAGNRLPLAVCYKRARGGGASINCGVCEKCVRTQIGLLLEGVDPNACGFAVGPGTLDGLIARFANHEYHFDDVTTEMWRDLQGGIPADLAEVADIHGSRRFFAWLRAFDVEAYAKRAFLANQSFLRSRLFAIGSPLARALPSAARRRLAEALR